MKKSHTAPLRGSAYNVHRNPNYPLAMGIMAESDGRSQILNGKSESFGASGRFDSETASEDSSTFKRKSVNLSCAGHKTDAFGIPIHVFSISQMSRSERMELRKKFNLELSQARSTRQKIECKEIQLTSSGSFPTVTDGCISRLEVRCSERNPGKEGIGSCAVQASGSRQEDNCLGRQGVICALAKEKITSKAIQHYLNSEYISSNGKILPAEKQNPKGNLMGVKRSLLGGFESRNGKNQRVDPVQSKIHTEQMKQCVDILEQLISHRFGWVFNVPVDPVKLNIPDYFKIITKPMDLGTVQTRLQRRHYSSPIDFAEDVRLTFSNAMKYNPPGNDVYHMAVTLKKLFESKWKAVETKLAGEEVYRKITQGVQLIPTKKRQSYKKIAEMENKSKASSNVPTSNVPMEQEPKTELCKRSMSFIEKAKLSKDLEQLSANMPEQIYTILKKNTGLTQCEDEVEVDIDSFNNNILWELRILVTNCLRDRGQGAKISQVSELVELPANSRVGLGLSCEPSNIDQHGGDAADENVDVGEDDITTNFPIIGIEKDTTATIKCSNSRSSLSSDSESSTSDSDSESSTGSDLDTNEVHSVDTPLKGTVESTAGCKMVQSDPETNGAVSVLDEQSAHPKAAVSDADAPHQEGESAPPERQVSPDKLLRAAMLKSRFADTILKAQEKTLNQGNKGDPEKLRHEREELEKWQREEKARIQAEAKSAEAVRKRAEAEAAATAKKKRQMEREAARLALQNMENSVEIEENDQILKDLERLSNVPADHNPSSADETSPVNYIDGLVNIPWQGRNPLEQLGLFIKSDEVEEESTADCAAGNGHVEEGEID